MKIKRISMMVVCMIVMSPGAFCRTSVAPSPHGMIQEDFCQHPITSVEITLGDEARDGLTTDELAWLKNKSNHLACSEVGLCWVEH